MVEVARTTPEIVERELTRAEQAWGQLPEVAALIGRWSEDEALDFLNEWSLEEDNLAVLRGRSARAELTPGQHTRFERVLELATRHRPIIARLMDGVATKP
jgi:hypothetical protein